MKNYLLSIQEILILFLLVCLPIIFVPFFDYPFETGKIILFYFVGILLMLVLGLRLLNEKIIFRFPLIILPFFLVNLLSFVFSWDKNTSFWGQYGYYTDSLIFLFYSFIVFLATNSLKLTPKFIRKIVLAAGAGLLIVAFFGLKEYYLAGAGRGIFFYRISSTFGQPNRLAQFLLPVNIFVLFSLSLFSQKLIKILLTFITFWGFVAFVLTFSKSNYLVLFLIILLIVFLQGHHKGSKIFQSPKTIFLVSILVIILVINKDFFINFKSIFAKNPYDSTYLRLVEQQASLKNWWSKTLLYKLFGTGPETVVYTYPAFKPLIINQNNNEWFWETSKIRNQYLHYLDTIGIVGLGSYLLLIFSFLTNKKASKKNFTKGVYFSFLTIVSSSLIYYQTIPQAVYFWFFLGILVKTDTKIYSLDFKSKATKIIFCSLVIFLTILQINFLGRFALADYYSHLGKIKSLTSATKLFPYLSVYKRKLAKKYLTVALLFWEESKKSSFEGQIKQAISLYQEAVKTNPNSIKNLRSLQWVLYNAGSKLDKSYQRENLEISQKLVQLAPTDPIVWDSLGLVYLDLGQLEQASECFGKAIQTKEDFVGSYLHLGETAKQRGEIEKAKEFYCQAAKLLPTSEIVQKELEKIKANCSGY